MDSSGPIGSEGIPVSNEEYQLFPEKISEESAQSSPSVSLPAGYRTLGQIMASITSMAASNPSRGLVLPSLVMSPMTHVSSTPFVTFVPTRPTICVAVSAPIVTTQPSRASPSIETSIAMETLDGLSFQEHQLTTQQQSSRTYQTPQDFGEPYLSHYDVVGNPIYTLLFHYDEYENPIYFPASKSYQFLSGFRPTLLVKPSNQQGQPF